MLILNGPSSSSFLHFASPPPRRTFSLRSEATPLINSGVPQAQISKQENEWVNGPILRLQQAYIYLRDAYQTTYIVERHPGGWRIDANPNLNDTIHPPLESFHLTALWKELLPNMRVDTGIVIYKTRHYTLPSFLRWMAPLVANRWVCVIAGESVPNPIESCTAKTKK